MKRHRPSEPFAPRPSDLIAPRLHLAAALVRAAKLTFEAEGRTWDGDALEQTAEDQARLEAELVAGFSAFRAIWVHHSALHRIRSAVLARATEVVEASASKHELRLVRLRRPPLAKVQVAIAEARRRSA